MKNTGLLSIVAVLVIAALPLSAAVITAGDVNLGTGVVTGVGTFVPSSSTLDTKTNHGVTGVGFTSFPGEIPNGQTLTLNFNQAFTVNSVDITFLFPADVQGDFANENARITFFLSGGGSTIINFTAGAALPAGVTHAPCVCTPDDQGQYDLAFAGGLANVTSIVFAPQTNGGIGNANSDFAFFSLDGAPSVPEPTTVVPLGLALLAGGFILRRRKA